MVLLAEAADLAVQAVVLPQALVVLLVVVLVVTVLDQLKDKRVAEHFVLFGLVISESSHQLVCLVLTNFLRRN
jgi:predicted Kef-type K+ transport protein